MPYKDKQKSAEYKKKWYKDNEEAEKLRKKEWYENNKHTSEFKLKQKTYNENNVERKREYDKNYTLENKERLKEYNLKRHYGIDNIIKNKMLSDQNYKCLIGEEKLTFETAHVDHCHKTKKVRGLLCKTCNLLLGHAKEDINKLFKAIDYLKERQE